MKLPLAALLVSSLLSLAAACGGDDGDDTTTTGSSVQAFGPRMRPGENCLGCHAENPVRSDATGPSGRKAPPWTAAGTVFQSPTSKEGLSGAKLTFVGKDGKDVVVTSNEVGNFYTDIPIDTTKGPSIEYQGRTAKMGRALPDIPACNACHDTPPLDGAPGRIYVP